MECDICATVSSGEPAFHCPACARALLYPHRINQAKLLLEKEQLRWRVESSLPKTSATPPKNADKVSDETAQAMAKLQHQHNVAEIQKSKERVEEIIKKSESLKEKVEQYKQEINSRKVAAERRRQENKDAKSEAASTRPRTQEQLNKSSRRRTHRYDGLYRDIVTARVCLCKEAAELAGLQRHQRRAPEGTILETYTLHGLPIIDLRDLNNTSPQMVTASLTSISRLLVQACYYLEVRLPAEITLPGENYPLSTIFTPASSFLPHNKDVPFPGIASSASSSPNASRTLDAKDQTPQSKLRPLYLDRKLPILMREDPSQYSYFVEGVSLLAWCVAWLCRTQGLSVANADWEEICAVGRNLWLLLIDTPTAAQKQQQEYQKQQQQHRDGRPKLSRKGTSDTTVKSDTPSKHRAPHAPLQIPFGVLSHGTAHGPHLLSAISKPYNTPSAPPTPSSSTPPSTSTATSAVAVVPTADVSPRTWKFASPTSIRDSLKKYLLNEISAQEWEVLSSGEFEGWVPSRAAVDEEPVVVGVGKGSASGGGGGAAAGEASSRRGRGEGKDDGGDGETEGMSEAPLVDGEHAGDEGRGEDTARPKGSSGWMKLKSRPTE